MTTNSDSTTETESLRYEKEPEIETEIAKAVIYN